MKTVRALALMLAALATPALAEVPEPDGYRMEEYRGPVPETLEGATVVTGDRAFALWEGGETAFIDVLPQAPKPANLPEGTIWRERPRASIPGATWLPNVGYGALADVTDTYFREGLEAATGGDMGHKVLFFCLNECWMSYNAAKRALSYGYSAVYWFPGGTDFWTMDDHPTEDVHPVEPQP